jgi:hypothetical protein
VTAEPIGINRETRRAVAKVAARPPARTVEVTIEGGDFDGWHAVARADFPAGLLVEFESGTTARILPALELIILEHNMPNDQGELAERLDDVAPYDGLMAIANALTTRIGSLPNR